jgi:hypothetical protein
MECAAVRGFTGVHNMIRGLSRLMEEAVSKAEPGDAKQMKVLSEPLFTQRSLFVRAPITRRWSAIHLVMTGSGWW